MFRPRSPLDRARDVALPLFLVYAAAVNFLAYGDYRTEDAYITFRYAANLAAGDGFVFNPGERVLGTSTPLWTLLLAALSAAGLDIVAAAGWLYTLGLSLCGYCGARLLARRGHPNAGAVFALAVVWGAGGSLLSIGMETALYLALIFLALLAAEADRPWMTGVLLGLVATTRYDGAVAVGVVLLARWLTTRKLPWREAIAGGVPLAGWLLFALLYFGSPLPNTLGAKAGDVGFLGYLGGSLRLQGRFLCTPLLRFDASIPAGVLLFAALLLLLPAAFLAHRLLRPGRRLWTLPAIAVLLWLGYGWIGPPLAHPWYLTPASLCLLAFGLAAWGELLRRPLRGRAAAAVLAAIALCAVALPSGARREARWLASSPGYRARQGAYDLLVTWMRDHDLDGATLFTREPGYLTYHTRQPVIDGAGLVTRGLFFHGPKGRRTSLDHIVETYRPDLMILTSATGRLPSAVAEAYLPVYQAQPRRLLALRRSVFERHSDRLAASLSGDYHPGPEPVLAHPLAVDFETWPTAGWHSSDTGGSVVGRPGAEIGGAAGRLLHTWSEDPGATRTVWSDPFRIDFDQLAFRFAATHPRRTVAQLYVGGLLALEVGGEAGEPLSMRRIVLPVGDFRGRVGVLRFVDADREGGFLAADLVESRRDTEAGRGSSM